MPRKQKDNKPRTVAEFLKQMAESLQNKRWGYERTQDGHLITAYWNYPLKEGAYRSKTYYGLGDNDKLPADLLKRFDDWTLLEPLDEEQKKLVLFFTDGVWDMPLLADFLRTNCNATEPEQLDWQSISKRLCWFAQNHGIDPDDIRQYPNLTFTKWQAKADLASTKPTETKHKNERSMYMIDATSSQANWEAIKNEYGISKKEFGKKINFVKDSFKRKNIFRDVEHAFVLASQGFSKPALILAGGVIEELLKQYLKHKNIRPKFDKFVAYIEACESNNFLKRRVSRLTDSIRDFRNMVHLDYEKTKKDTVSKATAKGAVSSIFTIAGDFQ